MNIRKDSHLEMKKAEEEVHEDEENYKSMNRKTFNERNINTDSHRKVYIILRGAIVAKDHDSDILLPQTLAKYTEGKSCIK